MESVTEELKDYTVKRASRLQGCLTLPGDKSISHRAAIISLLSRDKIILRNFSDGEDCRRSLEAVEILGGEVESGNERIVITPPANGMAAPEKVIDCGNSGTTLRLLAGLLAGAGVKAEISGDQSLQRRPMKRIIDPLRQMNANISGTEEDTAPLKIGPSSLVGIDYTLPVASAQVKSCLLLAGLSAGCGVTVREKVITRDHTERMINYLGSKVTTEQVKPEILSDPDDPRKKKRVMPTDKYRTSVFLDAKESLSGGEIEIPGDISTAAYFIAAAIIVPGSHIIIQKVGYNKTRTAFIDVLRKMGAEIEIKNRREVSGEPVADIEVAHSRLKARRISGAIIPSLIDELPVLAILGAIAQGTTIVRNAEELRNKESDRIRSLVDNLSAMGVKVGEFPDGFAIEGGGELNGAEIDSYGDHRIAMSFTVAGLGAHGKTIINDSDSVAVSCPRFFTMLEALRVK